MPPVPKPRTGKPVEILDRPLHFSFWPMYRTRRRYGLQTHVYATNPWALVRSGILSHCPASSRPEALAYLAQGKFFFDASKATDEWAAKPLLLYYSFMNLAKAFILTKTVRPTLDQAHHGLAERLRPPKKAELIDAYLEAYASPGPRGPNVFADFWQAVSGHVLPAKTDLDLPRLLPQIVAGHRLWADAADSAERFIALEDVLVTRNSTAKELWIVLHIHAGTLSQQGMTHKQLLAGALLDTDYHRVESFHDPVANETMLRFEQDTPVHYSHRPSDKIPTVVDQLRHRLWAVANNTRPFREYYLYVAPASDRAQVLPQLLSIYAVAFYLGSIARYRPQHFESILGSSFGAQLQEFLSTQPTQFLYLLASDFIKRDIACPALA